MSRAVVIVRSDADRMRAARWAEQATSGMRIEFKQSKRSIPQNDLMWALLTEVAKQVDWHGVRLTPDDWKLVFLASLKREFRMVPNIDGDGLVNLSLSTSDLGKGEMSDLIELIYAFGARHEVRFKGDDEERRAA